MTNILKRAKEQQTEIVRLRRTTHRHPELSFEEMETSSSRGRIAPNHEG